MKKQKKGILNFICSLIPGAGEMYMGFEKQGLSLMLIFWGIVSLIVLTGFGCLAAFLPVVWLYSFFHTHNLKNMDEELFQKEEDRMLIPMEELFKNRKEWFVKYRKWIAGFLIFLGVSIMCRELIHVFWSFLPDYMYVTVRNITEFISAGIMGVGIIIFGILMLHKKEEEE